MQVDTVIAGKSYNLVVVDGGTVHAWGFFPKPWTRKSEGNEEVEIEPTCSDLTTSASGATTSENHSLESVEAPTAPTSAATEAKRKPSLLCQGPLIAWVLQTRALEPNPVNG